MHAQDTTIQRGVTLARNVLREGQPVDLKGFEVRELARALLLLHTLQEQTSPVPSDDPIDGPTPSKPVGSFANTHQVGGEHYATGFMQHWDLVSMYQWDYFQGQITKYLMRWRKKGGVSDLEKAAHFLEKYIELARSENA